MQTEQVEVALEAAAAEAAVAAVDAAQQEMVEEASLVVEAELEMRAMCEVRHTIAKLALQGGDEAAGGAADARDAQVGPLSEAALEIRWEKDMLQNARMATHTYTLVDVVIDLVIQEVADPRLGFIFGNTLPSPIK